MNYYLVLQLTQRKQDGVVQITRNTFPCEGDTQKEAEDKAKVQYYSVLSTYGDKINKSESDIYWVYAEVVTIDYATLNTKRVLRDHVGSFYQEPIVEEEVVEEEATEPTETTEASA